MVFPAPLSMPFWPSTVPITKPLSSLNEIALPPDRAVIVVTALELVPSATTPSALIFRFATVIDPAPVCETPAALSSDRLVALFGPTPAAVTEIAPAAPLPIRTVVAVIWSSSASDSSSRLTPASVAEPRSISRAAVTGASVTIFAPALTVVFIAIRSALRVRLPLLVIALATVIVELVAVAVRVPPPIDSPAVLTVPTVKLSAST